ncbi:hypothetical protein GCM10023196_080510 [Actinoallomurus vinaceus]|uniref:Uncharacterized protein n=1 Tax=Actinoallomurus vinaceus TaxID=1080074 RepID=A0ABP8UMB4_9ACTN
MICGTGPPSDGGIRRGYDQEKFPVCAPTCHVEDGASGVAAKLPAEPDAPAARATTPDSPEAACAAGTATCAVTLPPATSLVDANGVCVRHSGRPGFVSAHAGSRTNRSREAQSPPPAYRNRE